MKNEFWKEMVVYQIWPRSFFDSDGDGIGDLNGITQKLPYIRSLGADAIWLSPPYVSPQHDYGYDVADYRDIAPEYGTMNDFKVLLSTAHDLGLRVIMDLVINHTSNEHKWFLESRKGGDENPYKDFYIWRKGKGKNEKRPPNNWTSMFPGPGWTYDEVRKEYYLHLFSKEQPDLNMDNPAVREEIKSILRFWLDMGVDGFREDVITLISKKDGLPNGFPLMPAARGMRHYVNGPNVHKYLQEFRSVINEYGAVTIGEAPMLKPDVALRYISGDNRDLDMMFHFQHMECDCVGFAWFQKRFSLRKLKRVSENWQQTLYGKGWNTLYLENHDQPRVISRYGSERMRMESGKCLATMYLCQGGTPFLYQGQEIGMLNMPLQALEEYPDISTHANYALLKKFGLSHEKLMSIAHRAARDNARTPMQWSGAKNAGFTTADKPWFRVNDNYRDINVEAQLRDQNSLLRYYKKLIAIRKQYPIFVYGDFTLYNKRDRHLFIYSRSYGDEKLLVTLNFSERPHAFTPPKGFDLAEGELLISAYPDTEKTAEVLRPYEARVYLFRA